MLNSEATAHAYLMLLTRSYGKARCPISLTVSSQLIKKNMGEIEDSDIEGKMGDAEEGWYWRRSGQATSDPSCSAERVVRVAKKEGDLAVEAPALPRACVCVWRPHYSLCFVHYARAGKSPLALPHLLPILPPPIHMKVLLTGATGAGQSRSITGT